MTVRAWRGDIATDQLDPSGNDGLWTAIYATSQCFRYAATRSPEALANAEKSIAVTIGNPMAFGVGRRTGIRMESGYQHR
jgi:hypothetical protein